MIDEVNQSPASPMEDPQIPEVSPLVAIHPLVGKKTNVMTPEELDLLRESYSFPPSVQIRLPEEKETIASVRLGEARYKKTLLRRYTSNVKGWKSKFFFASGDEWEPPEGLSREGVPRVPRTWGFLDKHCNKPPSPVPNHFAALLFLLGPWHPRLWTRNALKMEHQVHRVTQDGTKEDFTSCSQLNPDKRISLKKFGEKVEKSKNRGSAGASTLAKGVVIGEKQPRDDPSSLPSKKGATSSKPKSGNSPSLGTVLGPGTSILGSRGITEKILWGGIPHADQEKTLNGELEQQLAEAQAREQQASYDLAKMNEERNASVDKFESSKYFGEGFDFCIRQLRRHHPDLTIDLEGIGLDQDLLAEEDEAEEEKEKEGKNKKVTSGMVIKMPYHIAMNGRILIMAIKMPYHIVMNGYLDISDLCNGDQDALSYCNEWSSSLMAIKTPYHIVMNGRIFILATSAMVFTSSK
ncbi:hypothetical protein Acr_21g0002440 [Actinidia rufa]|uniref:Uncharacterized protein n=1 Tax=Actinidia rufa TaxID=165716 RepID=A0A7J0GFU6_9ERIC|nr:hypothetical protein Acr_21g0002440 [Actinidia rufa]